MSTQNVGIEFTCILAGSNVALPRFGFLKLAKLAKVDSKKNPL